jgi:hypothetical protein
MPRTRIRCLAIAFLLVLPRALFAQWYDAAPLRRGTVRVTFGGDWAHGTEWFGKPNPANPTLADGTREPLGTYFSDDSLGTAQMPFLSPLQEQLRATTGLADYRLNLGRAHVTLESSVRTMPIQLEWAATRRVAFTLGVPIVRAWSLAVLRGPDTSDAATQGNVGWNPGYVTGGTYDPFRAEVDTTLRALQYQAQFGPAALRDQAQAQYDASVAYLCQLYVLGGGSATDAASPCFAAGAAFGPAYLLPSTGTEAADSITAQLARTQSDYAALASQYALQGVTMPGMTQAFDLPTAVLDENGIKQVVTGPLAADSLGSITRTGIGDIELGTWIQLADRTRWRAQLQLLARLPTGTMDSPDNLVDLGTGDHQLDIEAALRADALISQHFWMSGGARYGVQTADELERRVTPWYLPYPTATQRTTVRRDLGDYLALDLVPRVQFNEAFGLQLGYHWFHQGSTTYEYTTASDTMLALLVPASVLGEGTSIDRMRVSAGVTFSTLPRYAAGRSRLPFMVMWGYQSTLTGRGGQVRKDGVMVVQVRAYVNSR